MAEQLATSPRAATAIVAAAQDMDPLKVDGTLKQAQERIGARRVRTGDNKRNPAAVAILAVALFYFLTPWVAAAIYGFSRPGQPFTFAPLVEVLSIRGAGEAITNTLLLTAGTTALMLVLLVPTIVFLNMKSPAVAKIAEMLSITPMVIPAVALVSGVSEFYRSVAPGFVSSLWSLVPLYVVLVMPLCYRAIDAGVKALDLQTLFAASSSLGASTWITLLRVIIPNLRVAMLSAALLCVAGVLGEYAMASLLLHYTFPVYMVQVSSASPKGVAALSFIVTIITWLLLVLIASLSRAGGTTRARN